MFGVERRPRYLCISKEVGCFGPHYAQPSQHCAQWPVDRALTQSVRNLQCTEFCTPHPIHDGSIYEAAHSPREAQCTSSASCSLFSSDHTLLSTETQDLWPCWHPDNATHLGKYRPKGNCTMADITTSEKGPTGTEAQPVTTRQEMDFIHHEPHHQPP